MPRTRSLAWSQLRIGLVGIAAVAMAAFLIVAVGGQGGFFWQRFPLKARFDAIAGLKTGAVVRLNGKEVGKVTDVQFAESQIEVTMQISKSVRPLITTESVASIGSLSLLGEPIIDLKAARTGAALADWSFVTVAEAGGPFGGLTATASKSLAQAGDLIGDVRAGRGTLGRLVTDDALYQQVTQLMTSADQFAKQLASSKGTMGKLINDPAAYQALVKALENLTATTEKIASGRGSLGQLVNDDALAKSLSASSASLEQITSKLNKGDGTAGKLLTDPQLYNRLNDMATNVNQLLSGLDAGRGTAGQLMHDQQLYDNLNKTVLEMRALLADIRKDPKKYLRVSVSIF